MRKLVVVLVLVLFSAAAFGGAINSSPLKAEIESVIIDSNAILAESTNNSTSGNSYLIKQTEGLRKDFKKAMDDYESFYKSYCDFMKKYQKNPTDFTLLSQYSDMLEKSEKVNKSFEKWDSSDLNDAELKYYLDVNNRVMKMLLEVSE